MQREIKKNDEITASSEQVSKLKALFPGCFDADGRFRPDKLEELLRADGSDITREGYKLDWLGKSYARLLANLKTETLLAPNAEHNAKPENAASQNILIQGDNLDVLKHLVNAYPEKVKLIYIDPPYNTGSDGFVYADDRKFTPEQLAGLAGIDQDEAKRILAFTQSNSNSHSAWLTFMFPRLYVARELLKDDGVIFISIDDNEQAQLKLLCDEVFGEENFIGNMIWKNKKGGGNDSTYLAVEHETIAFYAKKKSELGKLFEPYTDEYLKRYKAEDEHGLFYWDTFRRKSGKQYYPIVCPDGSVLEFDENGNRISWLRSEATFKKDLEKKEIVIEKSKDGWSVKFKQRLPEGKKPRSLLTSHGTTATGSDMILELFKRNVFDNPKPVDLISYLISLLSLPSEKFLGLDFFAGSGTFAHATLALNASDNGSRSFISVQLDEPTAKESEAQKAGFKTIFEVTRERIIRSAKKVQDEHPDATCDLGFKEFKTILANEGPFKHYLDDADAMEDYVPFDGMALDDEALNALLTTWKVYDGLPLHQDLFPIDLGGYTAHLGEHILYFVDKSLELKHITELLRRIDEEDSFAPRKLVVFHHVFGDKILREFSEAVNAPNRKHLELTFEQRF